MEAFDWTNLIGNVGIGGVLIWYLYFTTSVTLPKMQDSHQAAIREIVAEFRVDLKEERSLRIAMHSDLQALLARLGSRPCLLEADEVYDLAIRQAREITKGRGEA